MKKTAATLILATLAPHSFATEGASAIDSVLGAVDLSSVTTFIATTGVVIVGIALAVKGIALAKRLVSRA